MNEMEMLADQEEEEGSISMQVFIPRSLHALLRKKRKEGYTMTGYIQRLLEQDLRPTKES